MAVNFFRFYAETPAEAPPAEEEHEIEERSAEAEHEIERTSTEAEHKIEEPVPEHPIPPPSPPPLSEAHLPEEDDILHDTVLEEGEGGGTLAEINFGIVETGRWLLKVIGGPNNGAEFYMQSGHSYILGTDPHTCDIVFHDTSVSRQHAKITVTPEETLLIEDLKSRNGILINGAAIEEKRRLPLSTIYHPGHNLLCCLR